MEQFIPLEVGYAQGVLLEASPKRVGLSSVSQAFPVGPGSLFVHTALCIPMWSKVSLYIGCA